MKAQRQNFQLIAKPSGSLCNLHCDYCFYLEKAQLYPQGQHHGKMNGATLENFIRQHIDAQQADVVDFIWQGGEPTLLGLDFFREAVRLQQHYRHGKTINNFFQTNGIRLNDAWALFFKAHRFLVGISLDGDKASHDLYRKTRAGDGTFDAVMTGLAALKRHHVEFNTLTVINADNVKKPLEIYHFLKRAGSRYQQYIPLVERQSTQPDADGMTLIQPDFSGQCRVAPWSTPAKAWGRFLNTLFDHWIQHDFGSVFVMNFEQTLASLTGLPGICVHSETCGGNLVLEANGDVYACDHFVWPEYKLGNINQNTLASLVNTANQEAFGQRKLNNLSTDCLKCSVRAQCHGGCPKHRFLLAGDGRANKNYFCDGLSLHLHHCLPVMRELLPLMHQQLSARRIRKIMKKYYQGG